MVARPVDRAALIEAVCPGVLANPFIPIFPYPRQAIFMGLQEREALYGGAAGGAKTYALLADALQNVHIPKYEAVLFRRTFPELKAAGGLIPLSQEWLTGTGATYHQGDHIWTFPSGAKLRFMHLKDDTAAFKAGRGPEYQYMGWDEVTTFSEYQYRQPQSRLRRPSTGPLSKVPLKVRCGG